ncbi:twin-arginine translocase subunit TatC [Nocardiopsis mangrovi]|uniref:Sec-independent protein translocase protein TatC n=1 Tax=Nocardiopsis mangrovi TaxID=1179818 RepID=A0ABV9E0E2_9ACTN
MPLMDHLRELRNRVVFALLFVSAGCVVGFLVFDPVWDFLQRPYCEVPQVRETGECELIFTGIFDAFFLNFKVAAIVGVLVSSPFWLYQLWAFVAPALRGREKRYTYYFIGAAVPLFLSGAALAYYITGLAMEVLFGFGTEGMVQMIDITSYLNYMITMILVFGVAFVVPLIVVLLNLMGVLSHEVLAKWRRLIIFVIFVIAAVVTPAEPISMLALAIPLVVLYEAAELVCFLNDRRKGRNDPYADLDDDEMSVIEDADTGDDIPGLPPKR